MLIYFIITGLINLGLYINRADRVHDMIPDILRVNFNPALIVFIIMTSLFMTGFISIPLIVYKKLFG